LGAKSGIHRGEFACDAGLAPALRLRKVEMTLCGVFGAWRRAAGLAHSPLMV
jgi:hypothetical protein